MSDLESYLTRCYSLVFGYSKQAQPSEYEELCACSHMVGRDDTHTK